MSLRDRYENYLDSIGGVLPTEKEERDFVVRILQDKEVKAEIVERYEVLVPKMIEFFSFYYPDTEKLRAVGKDALAAASRGYDATKGGLPSRYVAWWIFESMKHHIIASQPSPGSD